jgi:hypothetical protein
MVCVLPWRSGEVGPLRAYNGTVHAGTRPSRLACVRHGPALARITPNPVWSGWAGAAPERVVSDPGLRNPIPRAHKRTNNLLHARKLCLGCHPSTASLNGGGWSSLTVHTPAICSPLRPLRPCSSLRTHVTTLNIFDLEICLELPCDRRAGWRSLSVDRRVGILSQKMEPNNRPPLATSVQFC